jgi:hypothetical protein
VTDEARAAIRQRVEELGRKLRRHLSDRSPLALVKAPPGSGKTHLLVELADYAVGQGAQVAVGAQTNSQADEICRRLAHSHPRVDTWRFAASSMSERPLGSSVRWVWKVDNLPVGPSVVVGTTAKWSFVDLDEPFDFFFVDEAWQMAWADFMLCAQVSKRFVLIGDPGQIPPVVPIDVHRWETSPRAPHISAPELILADPDIERLDGGITACRRLPADSVDLVRPFYDFDFDAWALPGERFVGVPRPGDGGEQVDPVLDLLGDGSVAALTLPTPKIGPPLEADLEVARVAASIAARALDRRAIAVDDESGGEHTLLPEDIGVVATHRVMNSAIEEALGLGLLTNGLRVDTPERWQGLERKLMIAVHPLSSVSSPTTFDLETGRLCVMASRHRAGLVLVSRDHLSDTLDYHVPSAEQALGRPDVTGRGHRDHVRFWGAIADKRRVIAA